VILDDAQFRNIGIVGYAGVLPMAALLLAILFSRARSKEACKTQPGLSHGDDTCKRFGYHPGVCPAEVLPVRARMLIFGVLLDCLEHLSLHQKVDGFEGRKQQF
jgi:hypothetical protein